MQTENKNDKIIMEAVKAANNGHHRTASALYLQAGNQYRDPAEKRALWDAADRSRRIAESD